MDPIALAAAGPPAKVSLRRLHGTWLVGEYDTQERAMDFQMPVVVNEAALRNLFMKWLTRERVVPIISASVSWLIFATRGSGRPSLPKLASSSSLMIVRAVRPSSIACPIRNRKMDIGDVDQQAQCRPGGRCRSFLSCRLLARVKMKKQVNAAA